MKMKIMSLSLDRKLNLHVYYMLLEVFQGKFEFTHKRFPSGKQEEDLENDEIIFGGIYHLSHINIRI